VPYKVSAVEIIDRFAQSHERVQILRGWLAHRAALRQAGFAVGFQWLDGSFVEDKLPQDLDVVTFLYIGAPSFPDPNSAWTAVNQNGALFDRGAAKAKFYLDVFFIDLLDPAELVVDTARYFLGLFSHQRITMIWKGMLQVRLEDDQDDSAALLLLAEREQLLTAPAPLPATTLSLFDIGGSTDAS
jgi:hypothetical protein